MKRLVWNILQSFEGSIHLNSRKRCQFRRDIRRVRGSHQHSGFGTKSRTCRSRYIRSAHVLWYDSRTGDRRLIVRYNFLRFLPGSRRLNSQLQQVCYLERCFRARLERYTSTYIVSEIYLSNRRQLPIRGYFRTVIGTSAFHASVPGLIPISRQARTVSRNSGVPIGSLRLSSVRARSSSSAMWSIAL